MITTGLLENYGWKEREPGKMMLLHSDTDYYFHLLGDNRYSIGIEEEEDELTPLFEGQIQDEAELKRIFDLVIYLDDEAQDEAPEKEFDLVSWLKQRGWEEGEFDHICIYETNDDLGTIYTCTAIDYNNCIIDVGDDETEPGYPFYIYNGWMRSEEDAEFVFRALDIPFNQQYQYT